MHGDGVLVPAELARPLARLAVIGAMKLRQDNGGLPLVPGMAALLAQLATAASGGEVRTVVSSHPAWLSVRQASEVSGYSARWLREMAHGGQVIARRPGRDWLIDPDSIPGRRVA